MNFDIITLFPKVFEPYLTESILGRALKNKIIKVKLHDLRKFSSDRKHFKVDDRPYGGGPGMVLKIESLVKAVNNALKGVTKSQRVKTKVVILSPSGKQFTNLTALNWVKNYKRIILICGHYEGVDARIKKIFKTEEVSIGPYVLTGGELPALIIVDSLSRKINGVLGKHESLEEERLGVGVPAYTRPEKFVYKNKKYYVPKELISGDHKAITNWRISHRKS
ncbi:MAG: tRNA (guanosine(37)-N1)-methyltransferase TrmD [Candidatus Colwellbacteria bacterium]|nr:tRNA (guanosine(37)-N1)-methyltransferase TrmD [Candidatus Colwellbacteria bacterium]